MFAECNIFAPGNQFSWKSVERSQGVFSEDDLKLAIAAAKAQGVGTVGHCLLWYHAIPDWVRALPDAQAVARASDAFVERMVDTHRDSVVRWDVINEQIHVPNKREDGLRVSYLLEKLGPNYMKRAFEVARRTDPKARLCYNEYGFEYRTTDERQKRDALIRLLRRFRDDKVELDVVGLQSHLDAGKQLDLDGLSRFVEEVKRLGYEIAITELDIVDTSLPADEAERDARVAKHAEDYLACVCAQARPTTITCWGFADYRTWLTMWHKRRDGRPMRPLPFDANLRRKPLWAAIRKFVV
jgi:endo-1,4-beta-xylanase